MKRYFFKKKEARIRDHDLSPQTLQTFLLFPGAQYPGYQRLFLACDVDLRLFVGCRRKRFRPKAEDTSGSRGSLFKTWPKTETGHEKPLAPRVGAQSNAR